MIGGPRACHTLLQVAVSVGATRVGCRWHGGKGHGLSKVCRGSFQGCADGAAARPDCQGAAGALQAPLPRARCGM